MAFYHQISHIPFGTRLRVLLRGAPSGILTRFLSAALEMDRRALETMGQALKGPDRPLVATFATMAMKPGRLAVETDAPDSNSAGAARGSAEATMRKLASQGVRTSILRMAPVVHGEGDRNGFTPFLIKTARKTGVSAYVGDGLNRWPTVHKRDAARLFRLALEKGPAGGAYHSVAEEGVAFREIAEAIGARLKVPVASKAPGEAAKQFGYLASFVPADNPTSSRLTQERLGWHPTEPGILSDLDGADYFKV